MSSPPIPCLFARSKHTTHVYGVGGIWYIHHKQWGVQCKTWRGYTLAQSRLFAEDLDPTYRTLAHTMRVVCAVSQFMGDADDLPTETIYIHISIDQDPICGQLGDPPQVLPAYLDTVPPEMLCKACEAKYAITTS